MKVNIRPIKSFRERAICAKIWENIFGIERQRLLDRINIEPINDYSTTWIAEVNGDIASTSQLFLYYARLGDTSVPICGIGNVATVPEMRGLGLARSLLTKQIEWIQTKGVAVAFLYTGTPKFYEKLGWTCCYRNVLSIPPEKLDYLWNASGECESVREFSTSDLMEVCEVYEKYNVNRSGSRLRDLQYSLRSFNYTKKHGVFLVSIDHGHVVGYARAEVNNDNCEIQELCYLHGYEYVCLNLIHYIREHVFNGTIELCVPNDHFLMQGSNSADFIKRQVADVMFLIVNKEVLNIYIEQSGIKGIGLSEGAALSIGSVCSDTDTEEARRAIMWRSDSF